MTYYTLLGYQVVYDLDDNVISVTDTSLSIEMPDGTLPNLTYTFETPGNPVPNPDDEGLPLVNPDIPGNLEVELLTLDLDLVDEMYLGYVDWDGNTSYILSFYYGPPGIAAQDWYFVIGGDALPEFTNSTDPIAEWNEFAETDDHITDVGHVTSGPYAPNRSIPLANLPDMVAHTGQLIESHDAADNEITTGAGNDAVDVGGGGFDVVRTLGGDDFVIVNGDHGYTEASVDLGSGNDILDFADAGQGSNGGPYAQLVHFDQLTSGITAIVNGQQNIGRVDKGASGETVILEVTNVMTSDGFGLYGTAFDDVIHATSVEGGFFQVRGLGGDDELHLTQVEGGTLRLDYRGDASGINANLETNVVQDGFGGTDTLIGSADELRGSMFSDTILGSDADERFILMAGSDTLDGGDGVDLLRYDRSGVEAVTVDLQSGTASGVWRTESFTHTISGIEDVRGSRDDNDMLAGNGGGNNLRGNGGDDTLLGRAGEDTLEGGLGNDSLDGGDGFDVAVLSGVAAADTTISEVSPGVIQVVSALGTDTLTNIEEIWFDSDAPVVISDLFPVDNQLIGTSGPDNLAGGENADTIVAGAGNDSVNGNGGNDSIDGGTGNDILRGGVGHDTLMGGDGTDTLIGGEGNDSIIGGDSEDDRRDVVYAGDGNDNIAGGYGNDELRGDAGNDTIAGGFGADTVIGGTGNDTLTGSAWADQIFGSDGDDFVNGGFGHDLLNGGTGADRFFHIGIFDHGSDWVQDYNAAEGDILHFGNGSATASQFQVNTTHTATAAGERSGDDDTEEAFVIYRPTGQIMWALVDGGGQSEINLQIGSQVYDLLA
ncbi:calcium-binding protein [Shimia thalassica]|uniref:calcium-binding protein n=1 Tax=Shimia thalassica TaxID=1715693 RepID=UPI0027352CFB|nr:calcium-binding protein [Shimia thalassica]MDP2578745.1 calcium-binding protein [Shimia thalassica]